MDEFESARSQADSLLGTPGVVGVGEGSTDDGRKCIVVMVTSVDELPADTIPEQILGVPVQVIDTGTVSAGG